MYIAIIQVTGVFLVSLFGIVNIGRIVQGQNVPGINVFAFAIGMAMVTCGIFF